MRAKNAIRGLWSPGEFFISKAISLLITIEPFEKPALGSTQIPVNTGWLLYSKITLDCLDT